MTGTIRRCGEGSRSLQTGRQRHKGPRTGKVWNPAGQEKLDLAGGDGDATLDLKRQSPVRNLSFEITGCCQNSLKGPIKLAGYMNIPSQRA